MIWSRKANIGETKEMSNDGAKVKSKKKVHPRPPNRKWMLETACTLAPSTPNRFTP